MTLERYIRLIAGSFILASLALAHYHSPYWLWFTAFVGVNLFQSALTRWCLMEDILKAFGVKSGCGNAGPEPAPKPFS
ncbi:MAG: DUF2892 domain-containing protein [Verrucomicrobia bacterium]|nr:DUF2892 domain-containing protein [Verrucomicrobiota bacterium]